MAESGEQSSGFWTLTRPSKLSKRRNSDLHELHHKVFNICVVGLSGIERDKGPIGIGKSCLCNRFVRSAADDYHTDHISVLSQSDFSGRVVNNDHWLYWGSVIKSCDGYDLAFNVIEQSEFVDDVCFQPFKSGKTEPYFKRCANTKLVSAEKLMYICKSQLGVEREYEQRYLPDGKFYVDGFLCLFDVSEVQGRNVDKQIEMTNLIMLNLLKTKKPIVFATTKNDEANELLVAEAQRIINQRDLRGIVPIVETSAQENININMAFLVCAQLIDKTRAKLRVPPYLEAYKNHLDLLNAASDAYLGLIRATVLDYRSSWQQVCIKLSHNPEFLQYTYLHGLDNASLVFKQHLKRLRDDCINQKVQNYLKIFPDILNELVPRNDVINNNNNTTEDAKLNSSSPRAWELAKEQLRSHPLFNKYFLPIPAGISWYDTELLQSSENRIPSDWLDSEEAHSVFHQRNLLFEAEQARQTTKEMFAQMLSEMKVPVGKPFIELKHLFASNPNFGILSDKELFDVYVEYQNNLLQQARADFQELLLENADHLHHLTSSNKVIRQEDIKTINSILQHDERYQALDRFDQDRTLMMIRHLSFLHSQISEQCPSYPKCVEPEIERLLITKAKSLVSRYFESKPDNKGGMQTQKTCDLVIFGPRRPSQQLILALNVLNSRAAKALQYQITFTVFDNSDEVDSQIQRFKKSDTRPKGCFGIFTNQRSLAHVSYTLEKFLILSSQVQNDKNHFGPPPVVMLYAADITLDERTMLTLENEGQQVADRFKCPFMNVTAIDQYRQHQQNNLLANEQDSTSQVMSECASLDYACVDAAFNVLKEAVSRRVCFMELYNNQDLIPRQAFNPDARILMCLLCGEPFSNDLFMWKMFLDFDNCYVTSSKSICLRVKLDNGQEKFIEVIITSYTHGAFNYREDLLHGFILVCSIQRKASLSILNAFSFNIPCTPVLVMAINSDVRSSNDNNDQQDIEHSLIKEAQAAANRLKGHFEMLDLRENGDHTNETYNIQRIRNFLQSVIKRKPTIEKAYELGDSDIQLPTCSDYDEYLSSKKFSDKIVAKERTTFRMQRNNPMSSDDDLNGPIDKNLSDDSEAYSTTSNSAPPKPIRFTKSGGEALYDDLELHSSLNELYAKRPLPPIPPTTPDRFVSDREFELSIASLSVPTPAPRKIRNIQQQQQQYLSHLQTGVQTSQFFFAHLSSISQQRQDQQQQGQQRPHKPSSLTRQRPVSPLRYQRSENKFLMSTHDTATNLPKKSLGNKFEGNRQQALQASEETNESSSDGDTEDSTEAKQDKPKPGKLDLSQFDNITNAIGKLNVQPPKKVSSTEISTQSSHSKVFTSQVLQENSQDTAGFFKSRTKKVRGRPKDAPQGGDTKDSNSNDRLASFVTKKRQAEVRGSSEPDGNSAVANNQGSKAETVPDRDRFQRQKGRESATQQQRKLNPTREAEPVSVVDRSIRDKSSRFKNETKPNRVPASSFLTSSPAQESPVEATAIDRVRTEKDPPPRPAIRSTQSASKQQTHNPIVPSFASSMGSTTGAKRINNPRQNHGRAVAPPQLPSDLATSSSATRLDESNNDQLSLEPTPQLLAGDEGAIDFSQSPIAQRLLKQSKDHKVSELNSPYESDCETSQSMNLLRGTTQKLYRGQSLGSENSSPGSLFMNSSIDSSELINSRGAAIRQLNEILANKQPSGRPGGPKLHSTSRSSSLDQEQQQQQQQSSQSGKKNDKDAKKDKKKLRDDEKLEKRRLKEEERLRRQEKKLAAKKSKSGSAEPKGSVGDDGIPFFIKRCIEFIEFEGLDAEGIYRVPGNRAHVDAFVQKFKENPNMSIVESDIPVNAVATALKDFLSKKWGPIIPLNLMNELTELSNISEKEQRVQAVRNLVNKLPPTNYKLLKYVFSHFVKVSLNHSLNSMDSKNLAICWWPTLLPLHFSDMVMFEQMRPHLEESIQTMIDQYDFIFDSEEPAWSTTT